MVNACREAEESLGDVRVGVIYMATCLVTGLSYIGQTVDFVSRQYMHQWDANAGIDTYFYRAVRKHGWDAFAWRILAVGIPLSQLDTQEIFWIRFYNTYLGPGYNLTAGGDSNPMDSPENRAKISAWWALRSETELAECGARLVVWWDSLTDDEKSAVTEHRIASVRAWRDSLSDAELAEFSAKLSVGQKKAWASLTEEERAEKQEKMLAGYLDFIASLSPEERIAWTEQKSQSMAAWWASLSEEDRAEQCAKSSAGQRAWRDSLSEEELADYTARRVAGYNAWWASQSAAERANHGKKVSAGRHAKKRERQALAGQLSFDCGI